MWSLGSCEDILNLTSLLHQLTFCTITLESVGHECNVFKSLRFTRMDKWYIIELTNQGLLDKIPMDMAFLLMEIFGHH